MHFHFAVKKQLEIKLDPFCPMPLVELRTRKGPSSSHHSQRIQCASGYPDHLTTFKRLKNLSNSKAGPQTFMFKRFQGGLGMMLLKADRMGSIDLYNSPLFKSITSIPQTIFHCHHSGENRKQNLSSLSPILCWSYLFCCILFCEYQPT